MKKHLLPFVILLICLSTNPFQSFSQRFKLDSLINFTKTAKSDSNKVKALVSIGKEYEFINQDSAAFYLKTAYKLAEKTKFEKGKGSSLVFLGYLAEDRSDIDSAQIAFSHAYEIFKKINDIEWQAEMLKIFGTVARYKADLKGALKYYIQSLELYESINSEEGIANVNYSMGGLYMELQQNDKALECYLKGYEANKKANRRVDMGNDLTAIGIMYDRKKDYKKAKEYYADAKRIYDELGYDNGLSNLYTWMAITAYNEKDVDASLDYFQKSLKLYEKINSINGLMYVYNNIGSIYAQQGLLDKALEWQNKSLELAKKHNVLDNIRYAYEMLSITYSKKGDYKNAYESHKLYIQYKDSIINESTTKQLSELDKKFETEKKNKELIKKDAELLKQNAKIDKQNNQRNYLLIGLALMAITALFIFRSLRQKKKANEIIAQQKLEVENQKGLLEIKQKEILDSINYAKRIQAAILPDIENLQKHLNDSFILYQPKDIVSGDFYWFAEKENKLIVAIADCTGHGVPGAFMSMVGNDILTQIVIEKGITKPNLILTHLHDGVKKSLKQDSNTSNTKDGMDIAIVSFDKSNYSSIEYAGALRPLWLIKNNSTEITEYKADKHSIGGAYSSDARAFTNHELKLSKGDSFYLSTDGYADQFGGEQGKKMMTKNMKELLIGMQSKKMEEQKEILQNHFQKWKANREQVDDVLVFGVRV